MHWSYPQFAPDSQAAALIKIMLPLKIDQSPFFTHRLQNPHEHCTLAPYPICVRNPGVYENDYPAVSIY
jgi:hypothetical protein